MMEIIGFGKPFSSPLSSTTVDKRLLSMSFSLDQGEVRAKQPAKPNLDFLSATSNVASKRSQSLSSSSVPEYTLLLQSSSKLSTLDKPNYLEALDVKGKRKLKKIKQLERERTKGKKWYNMPATELTQERKNDLEALRLRGALDTKRFYKRNAVVAQPKYFQVGTVVETAADYYTSRVPKRQRKKTFAEEIVAEISRP